MRAIRLLSAVALLGMLVTSAPAADISGEYLEARTCDVYTGPCFANAEINIAGKKAVMAWKVDRGSWNNVELDGLSVALIVRAEGTLGDDGIFGMKPGKTDAVILVDEKASADQQQALVAFVKESAAELADNVVRVEATAMSLQNDHLDGRGLFEAGKLAKIETRALKKSDCVCTNEEIFYQPLTNVENFSPAYSQTLSFQGEGLNGKFTNHGLRSAFLATFRK